MKTIGSTLFRKSVFTAFTLAALGLTACDDDVIRGRGDTITKFRVVSTFDAVEVKGDFEVYLTQGPGQEVRLEGQENVLDAILTQMDGRELEIKFKPYVNVRNHKPIRVYITNPTLTGVELSG